MLNPRLLLAIGAAGLTVVAVAACTSSTAGSPSTTPVPVTTSGGATSTTPTVTTTVPVTSTPPATRTTTVTAKPTRTTTAPPKSATARPTTSAPAGPPTCQSSGLRTDVLRGSGIAGQQFAMISFTNTGAAVCNIVGYPGVSLLAAGAQLGAPAAKSGKTYSAINLAPGKTVSTTLVDFSTCNAPNSDTVRIYPPNNTVAVQRPLILRGCRLQIDPVAAS